MARKPPAPPEPTVAYPRVTPRRTIVMADDIWDALTQLGAARGVNTSAMLRLITVQALNQAREAGEIPKQRRRST